MGQNDRPRHYACDAGVEADEGVCGFFASGIISSLAEGEECLRADLRCLRYRREEGTLYESSSDMDDADVGEAD